MDELLFLEPPQLYADDDASWTKKETSQLLDLVTKEEDWKTIALKIKTKSPQQCCSWYDYLEKTNKYFPKKQKVNNKCGQRKRRKAAQIERLYKCQEKFCNRAYGTDGALKMHIKLKHPSVTYNEAYQQQARRAAAILNKEEEKFEDEDDDYDEPLAEKSKMQYSGEIKSEDHPPEQNNLFHSLPHYYPPLSQSLSKSSSVLKRSLVDICQMSAAKRIKTTPEEAGIANTLCDLQKLCDLPVFGALVKSGAQTTVIGEPVTMGMPVVVPQMGCNPMKIKFLV